MRNYYISLTLSAVLAFAAVSLAPASALSAGPGFYGESFTKTFYFYGPLGKGSHSGLSAGNAKPIADTDLMSIEAGTVITGVYVIIDAAITGSTVLDIGDDDDADGFCPSASLTFATPGMYCHNANVRGAYLKVVAAGGIYSVPNMKFYSVAGKEVKLDNTTTNTAGAFRVVVQGYKVGA